MSQEGRKSCTVFSYALGVICYAKYICRLAAWDGPTAQGYYMGWVEIMARLVLKFTCSTDQDEDEELETGSTRAVRHRRALAPGSIYTKSTVRLHCDALCQREFPLGWRGVGTVRRVSSIQGAGGGLFLGYTDPSVTGHPGVPTSLSCTSVICETSFLHVALVV